MASYDYWYFDLLTELQAHWKLKPANTSPMMMALGGIRVRSKKNAIMISISQGRHADELEDSRRMVNF